MNCQYCGDAVYLEPWLQRMYPKVDLRCLLDGTHQQRPKVGITQILREDKNNERI